MHGLNWMSYRPDHEVQCCPGNVHRAMPNFIGNMWMRTAGGGIIAALYGPGTLHTVAGEPGQPLTIGAQTRYLYQQSVEFRIEPAGRGYARCRAISCSPHRCPSRRGCRPGWRARLRRSS
jgi:DUF1680 family protein